MRVPRGLETAEPAYLATRAAVRCALAAGLECVAIPGMGTGVGGLHPQRAARAMMHAIHDVLFPRPFPASLAEVYAFCGNGLPQGGHMTTKHKRATMTARQLARIIWHTRSHGW